MRRCFERVNQTDPCHVTVCVPSGTLSVIMLLGNVMQLYSDVAIAKLHHLQQVHHRHRVPLRVPVVGLGLQLPKPCSYIHACWARQSLGQNHLLGGAAENDPGLRGELVQITRALAELKVAEVQEGDGAQSEVPEEGKAECCRDGLFAEEGNLGALRIQRRNKLLEQFSHHQDGIARLNHGSFGSCPSSVQKVQAHWASRLAAQPDAFSDTFSVGPLEHLQGLLVARRAVAELINAGSVDELVLVDNTTVAIATIALDTAWGFVEGKYQKGDAILLLDCAYGAVRKSFKAYAGRAGAQVLEVKIPFPVKSEQEVVSSFESALQEAKRAGIAIRLAVIDHIVSMPTLLLPVKQLVSLCRKYGVDQVLVDGAHAIGSTEVDVQAIDADYYASDLHKWLFAPISASFLHCKRQHLFRLHHPIVSHNYGQGLVQENNWTGTRDFSALFTVPAAIRFVKDEFGSLESLREENHNGVIEMAQMLASAWGTHLGAPPEMYASMAMVALPPSVVVNSQDEAENLRARLREEFCVEVPICHARADSSAQGSHSAHVVTGYVRISHQVYNSREDYNRLRDAVLSLSHE